MEMGTSERNGEFNNISITL